MDNRYYENVIEEMKPFLNENEFKEKGEFFSNGKKAFSVKYDEETQMYNLSIADVDAENGEIGEFKTINSWLFDDTQNAKDAISVGIDFTSSLRKELGIKVVRKSNGEIDLPTASKGNSANISGFAKKMLDVFPVLKDEYKNHVAIYGNFLYLNFFGEHLVPLLKDNFENYSKKSIKKIYDVIEDFYVKGDKDTVNTIIALLCAASYNSSTAEDGVKTMLAENNHFLASYNNFIPVFAKNKKLLNALIK